MKLVHLSLLPAILLGVLAGCVSASEPPLAPTPTAAASEADALEATDVAQRYLLPTPGSAIETGGAIIAIDAPMDRVLEVLQDYARYHEILPRIDESRVVGKQGNATDVYLRAPILGGDVAVWGVARFSEPRPWRGKGKQITGKLVRGNLEAWRGAWKLYPLSAGRTSLRMELYADVEMVPDAWISPELVWATDKSVTAVRDLLRTADGDPRQE